MTRLAQLFIGLLMLAAIDEMRERLERAELKEGGEHA